MNSSATQMKLHPKEFIGPILKAHVAWTAAQLPGVPPFDLLATIIHIWHSNPRSQIRGPWTAATVSSFGANYGRVDLAQSNLLQSALPLRGPYGLPQHASWQPHVFLLLIVRA